VVTVGVLVERVDEIDGVDNGELIRCAGGN